VRHRAHLVEQVLFDLVGEAASCERVPGEPAVLDQEPVVDSTGSRASGSSFSPEIRLKGQEAPSIGVLRDQADDLARRDR
jgi:hypothetical protein